MTWKIRVVLIVVTVSTFAFLQYRKTRPRPSPAGIVFTLPQEWSLLDCGDDRSIVLRIFPDGQTWINETAVPRSDLPVRLKRIFDTRDSRILFVNADKSLPFETVAQPIADVEAVVQFLNVVPITERDGKYDRDCQAMGAWDKRPWIPGLGRPTFSDAAPGYYVQPKSSAK